MTERQNERRMSILRSILAKEQHNLYEIRMDWSRFISIRNKKTLEGIYTDSLQNAKKWIRKDATVNLESEISKLRDEAGKLWNIAKNEEEHLDLRYYEVMEQIERYEDLIQAYKDNCIFIYQ